MAKKKSKGTDMAVPQGSGGSHLSTSIDEAENGFVVNVSGDHGGKTPSYFSKRYIATSRPAALRLANNCLMDGGKGKAGKKGNRKKAVKR